jgi:ABC-type sugar transport system ATPase subunit
MNFLDAEIKASDTQRLTLMLANGACVVVPAPLEKLNPGEKLKLGVRAEHLALAPQGELQGEIEVLEHLGPRAYLHARLADGTTLVAQTDGDTQARIGDRAAFHMRSEAAHLFDASGKALPRGSAGSVS